MVEYFGSMYERDSRFTGMSTPTPEPKGDDWGKMMGSKKVVRLDILLAAGKGD